MQVTYGSTGNVALNRSESVSNSSRLQEPEIAACQPRYTGKLEGKLSLHECEEDKDLAPKSDVRVLGGIPAESRESGQDDEHDAQAVPERERSMNEQLLGEGLASVLGLDDVVDLGYGGRDEEGEDERGDVPCFRKLLSAERRCLNEGCVQWCPQSQT